MNIPVDPIRSWAVVQRAEGDLTCVPTAALPAQTKPIATVSVLRREDVPEGMFEQVTHVRENAQEFDVSYFRYPQHRGLLHGRGGNQILWSDDLSQFFVTESEHQPELTWVYARFVLRHLIVDQFLLRPGFRRVHAAAGTLPHLDGLLIAGPYLSGKTHLLNALIERGILLGWVEDDCAVLDANLTVRGLIPLPETPAQTHRRSLSIMLCLDKSCSKAEWIGTQDAFRWALNIQASWPVSWLPHHSTISTDASHFGREIRCLRLPERPAPEDVIAILNPFLEGRPE